MNVWRRFIHSWRHQLVTWADGTALYGRHCRWCGEFRP